MEVACGLKHVQGPGFRPQHPTNKQQQKTNKRKRSSLPPKFGLGRVMWRSTLCWGRGQVAAFLFAAAVEKGAPREPAGLGPFLPSSPGAGTRGADSEDTALHQRKTVAGLGTESACEVQCHRTLQSSQASARWVDGVGLLLAWKRGLPVEMEQWPGRTGSPVTSREEKAGEGGRAHPRNGLGPSTGRFAPLLCPPGPWAEAHRCPLLLSRCSSPGIGDTL